jgi:peptidyl-prolyl cis-trans isomerase C
VRRSVLVAVLLASIGCRGTPAQSQTNQPATGKPGASTAQPAGQAGQPGQKPATPGAPGAAAAEPPPVKPVPAQLPEVLARIGTEPVTKAEFEKAVRAIEARAGQPVPIQQRDQIYRRILDQVIDMRLIQAEAKARNITVPDTEVDTRIGQIKQQFKTEEEFTQKLASQQLTLDQLKQELQKDMVISKCLEAEITPKVNVQQAELDAFYAEHPEQFKQPEAIRASHILISVDSKATDVQKQEAKALADGLLKRARGGEDFGALAKQYSKDSSAQNGGDLNFFPRGQMVPAFETAAFALKAPGDISDVVETPFGYHIIKLTEKKPESTVPLAQVSTQLTDYLKKRKQQEMTGQFVQSLRTKYKVEVLI